MTNDLEALKTKRAIQGCNHAPAQDPTQLRAQLRAGIETSAVETQLGLAKGITVAAIHTYWSAISPDVAIAPLREIVRPAPSTLISAAADFGAVVSRLPVSDAAYHLGLLYTSLLPSEWRSRY